MKELFSWGRVLLIGFVAAVLINAFVLQAYRVQGHSMVPTLQDRDYTLLLKLDHSFQYGDIVVIDSRLKQRGFLDDLRENALLSLFTGKQEDYLWIKRVIGKPGDKLEIKANRLYRNGKLVDEPYINEAMRNNPDRTIDVPAGHIFVMGDNRNHSTDSRVIGPVPLDDVLGKVVFRR